MSPTVGLCDNILHCYEHITCSLFWLSPSFLHASELTPKTPNVDLSTVSPTKIIQNHQSKKILPPICLQAVFYEMFFLGLIYNIINITHTVCHSLSFTHTYTHTLIQKFTTSAPFLCAVAYFLPEFTYSFSYCSPFLFVTHIHTHDTLSSCHRNYLKHFKTYPITNFVVSTHIKLSLCCSSS